MKNVYTFSDLQDWKTVTAGESPPIKLGVIGDPVAHSLSPEMHNPALEATGIGAQYCRLRIRAEDVAAALRSLPSAGFLGVNVTIPHKGVAMAAMDEVDDHVRKMRAVNTVVVEKGKLLGFSTDGPGFVRAVREEFSMDLRDLRVMVLGAGGGAGRSIAVQCAMEGCERLVLVNRTPEKVQALAAELTMYFRTDKLVGRGDRLVAIPWEPRMLKSECENVDLIVNATSLGMNRMDPAVLGESYLTPSHLVYDTVYAGGRESRLLEAARDAGARGANGLSMLLHQGALSFEIWFGRTAPVEAMRRGLMRAAME